MVTTTHDPRRERVLDAAAAIFARMGYTHASTAAIAGRAGVSKATLYAYWPGKEQLFHALVVRESLRVLDAWEAAIVADPDGGTVGPLVAHGYRALDVSPLLREFYAGDTSALGDLFRRRGRAIYTPRYRENLAFVRAMQRAGVMRDDLPAEALNHLLQALSLGMVTVGELVEPTDLPDVDVVADAMARTLQGALAPREPASSEEGKAAIRAYFRRLRALMLDSTLPAAREQETMEDTSDGRAHSG